MSFSRRIMNLMGSTNVHWGVCGFTSTFYAMYTLHPGKRPLLLGAGIATKVLAEIKTYLMMLKAAGDVELLHEIEAFTRSFGVVGKADFSSFAIDDYIRSINKAVGKSEKEITGNPYYSIGMPPAAVVDYLRRIWGHDAPLEVISGGSGGASNGILGVSKGKMSLYDGLCHYLYRHEGRIYSWGKTFGSVTEADPAYQVCRLIKIKD